MPESPADTAPPPPPPEAQHPHSPRGTLPSFTPVPRQRMRRGGWSAARQREFIERLAELGSVRAACRAMGVGEHHIYKLRRHPDAGEFRQAWEAALDLGVSRVEDVLMDRALNGVEVPVYSYGKLVGTRRVFNDRLLMFVLRNRAPERFGGGAVAGKAKGRDAIGKMERKRLKKKWHAKWERDSKPDRAAIVAEIERKLDLMQSRRIAYERERWALLSDDARQAFVSYVELRARDLDEKPDIPFFLLPHEGDPLRENWWHAPEDWKLTRRDRWAREGEERGCGVEEEEACPEPSRRAPTLPPPDWRGPVLSGDEGREEPGAKDDGPRIRRLKDDDWQA